MANHEINEEQEAVNKVLRMIETSDPVHADVYNALFSVLINNDVFLEKLANKMVQQVMISHVMDSTNPDMVMGADQGPVITKLIEKVREQVNVLNTKQFCRLINNVSVSYLLENSDEYCVSLYRTHYLTGIPETASTDFLIMCMRYDKTSGWVIVKDLQTSALYVITCVLGEYGKWTTIIS